MTTYTDAHRKYYQKNKDSIYRRTKKYKEAYNKKYHLNRKQETKNPEMSSDICVTPEFSNTQKE